MKFKVGDKVRVIGNSEHYKHGFEIGKVCTITNKNENTRLYKLTDDGFNTEWLFEHEFELVKDDTQVKHHAPKVYEVYEELKRHVGAENAISATDLCRVCGVSSHRELREIMRSMRRSGELEKIPCSCNKGYYMASTKEEAQNAIDRLVNTAKNELKTAYTMAKKLGLDGQMKIQFGKYWKDTYHSLMEEGDETDTETD